MADSYAQVQKQIKALQAEAEKLKQRELGDVIARIKEAIAHYGLTAAELFDRGARKGARGAAPARRRGARPVKYSDGQGNVWGGRGPRPQWLRDALASGKKLEDFGGAAASANGFGPSPKAKAGSKKKSAAARYQDGAGNTWSGRGRKPKWFTDALAAGKSPEDLAAR